MATVTPTCYSVQVGGHLDDHWARWLGDWSLRRASDGTTTLMGRVADQAQLHGLLGGLRDIGAVLLEVSACAEAAPTLLEAVVTERLLLRPGTEADADVTWAYRRLESVAEWLTELPSDPEEYRRRFAEPERLANTVVVEHAGRVVGDFMVRVQDAWAQVEAPAATRAREAELGAVLDPTFSGQGFATEAVEALLDVCFKHLGVRRVVGNCFLANEASWRLMERVGMRREEHAVQESLHRSGEWMDTLTYAILRDEWIAQNLV